MGKLLDLGQLVTARQAVTGGHSNGVSSEQGNQELLPYLLETSVTIRILYWYSLFSINVCD